MSAVLAIRRKEIWRTGRAHSDVRLMDFDWISAVGLQNGTAPLPIPIDNGNVLPHRTPVDLAELGDPPDQHGTPRSHRAWDILLRADLRQSVRG